MPIASHVTYGKGHHLLFAFHGYGMSGRQFQVLKTSIGEGYQVVGFHLPYHKGGTSDHEGWLRDLVATIKLILKEKEASQFSLAGYSIGSKIALSLLRHFKEEIQDMYLFAPYGLTKHRGISFLESGVGKVLFRFIVGTSLPLKMVDMVHLLGIISTGDHEILTKELDSLEKRQNLRRTFLLMSELGIDRKEVLAILKTIRGKVRLVFGKHDAIFSLSSFSGRDQFSNREILEVEEGHWLMTEKLEALLLKSIREIS